MGTAATLVPTPSPSPLDVHVITDSAPGWVTPLLTGAFVLAAASITTGGALFSLWFSDRRKLRREDQRQWDNDLKKAYVAIASAVSRAQLELARLGPSNPRQRLDAVLEQTEEAMRVVQEQVELLQLIAPVAVSDAANDVLEILARRWERGFEARLRGGEDDEFAGAPMKVWQDFKEVDATMTTLRNRVREAIRIEASTLVGFLQRRRSR
ncbi:hypothetical protein [Curtobacterium sp. PhB78]|uniref:hypothetical protein n=1 Tax=Curtobacterium sp. PhB78 TaxID=2485102 RepID=UPI000F487EBE|nr:hypothetical protein [Curtobacterium sp. PhB78]ROS46194.1 hypothetical protein EDF53_1013 [Curtobacterium sp. PhB78]